MTLFFVLSGFLLSRPWFLAAALGGHGPSSRHYLWKRALRILPLYWVVVVVALHGRPRQQRRRPGTTGSRNLTLTQLYRPELLPELADPDVEPVHRGRCSTSCCRCICVAFVGPQRPRPSACAACWSCAGLISVARRRLAGRRWRRSPAREGHYAPVAARLPALVHGRARLRRRLGQPDRPPARAPPRPASAPTSSAAGSSAVAVFALACSPLAGPRLLLTPAAWEAGAKVVLYGVAGAFIVLPLVFGPGARGLGARAAQRPGADLARRDLLRHLRDPHDRAQPGLPRSSTSRSSPVGSSPSRLLTLAITIVLATISFYLFERPILRAKNLRFFARMEPADLEPEPELDPGDRSVTELQERTAPASTAGRRRSERPRRTGRLASCWPRSVGAQQPGARRRGARDHRRRHRSARVGDDADLVLARRPVPRSTSPTVRAHPRTCSASPTSAT